MCEIIQVLLVNTPSKCQVGVQVLLRQNLGFIFFSEKAGEEIKKEIPNKREHGSLITFTSEACNYLLSIL